MLNPNIVAGISLQIRTFPINITLMKKIILLVLALSVVWAIPVHAKQAVKIGLICPLTGDVKTFGESSRNAFMMALEDYAKTGKYAVTPVIVDDRNDPTEGANAALKLITQDRVLAFVGPLTSKVAIPVSEIATQYKTPMVTEPPPAPR